MFIAKKLRRLRLDQGMTQEDLAERLGVSGQAASKWERPSPYDDDAVLMDGHRLSEYFPQYKRILYTYDMGDNWEHEIELVRIIDEHTKDSPYLLEAFGQAPPEDVGGTGGFISFCAIMMNPNHPENADTKEWGDTGRLISRNGKLAQG